MAAGGGGGGGGADGGRRWKIDTVGCCSVSTRPRRALFRLLQLLCRYCECCLMPALWRSHFITYTRNYPKPKPAPRTRSTQFPSDLGDGIHPAAPLNRLWADVLVHWCEIQEKKRENVTSSPLFRHHFLPIFAHCHRTQRNATKSYPVAHSAAEKKIPRFHSPKILGFLPEIHPSSISFSPHQVPPGDALTRRLWGRVRPVRAARAAAGRAGHLARDVRVLHVRVGISD